MRRFFCGSVYHDSFACTLSNSDYRTIQSSILKEKNKNTDILSDEGYP